MGSETNGTVWKALGIVVLTLTLFSIGEASLAMTKTYKNTTDIKVLERGNDRDHAHIIEKLHSIEAKLDALRDRIDKNR